MFTCVCEALRSAGNGCYSDNYQSVYVCSFRFCCPTDFSGLNSCLNYVFILVTFNFNFYSVFDFASYI